MGGKGSGGSRVSAGRKPKNAALAALHNSRDRGTRPAADSSTPPAAIPPAQPKSKPLPPPRYLSDEEKDLWKTLAPHAHALGTLTPETAMAFADLVEAILIRRRMAKQIQDDGLMLAVYDVDEESGTRVATGESRAHPLIARHQQQLVRVNDLRARFRLVPDGKERVPPGANEPKPESALERLQRQAAEMRRPVGV